MLNRPREFSAAELERLAAEAERDFLNRETYLESAAAPVEPGTVALSRADLVAALRALRPEFGLEVSLAPTGDAATLQGLDGAPKVLRLAWSAAALDADPAAQPLTALSPVAGRIAERLNRPGESLPLVLGSHRAGAFRRSVALWVTEHGMEPLTTLAALVARLDTWDGCLPPPNKMADATRHARHQAENEVRAVETRARERARASFMAQREAATLRLAREVARLLRCLDHTTEDLPGLLEAQAGRTGPLAERLRAARDRLAGRFIWTDQTRWELEQFMKGLTPNDRQSRLTGSSLDAALADPRWISVEPAVATCG
jgi:hypothetical protein